MNTSDLENSKTL